MMPASTTGKARSLSAADFIALLSAAALLLVTVWVRGPGLLHASGRLYAALLTTIGFAVAARIAHGVNTSGAMAGAVIAFSLASRELRIFWVLLVVFFVTLAATRIGSSRKRQLRIAESENGRSASQVMANLGIAALVLVLPNAPFAYVALAALAEVAADTTSSEIGTALSSNARLITTWKPVPSGTNGGVTLSGTLAGFLAAAITAGCAALLGLAPLTTMAVIAVAGAGGMTVDSFLGALLEQRGYLNNDLVNLLSTASAAGIAWLLQDLMR